MLVIAKAELRRTEKRFHKIPAASTTNGSKAHPTNNTSKSSGTLLPAINNRMRDTAAPMIAAAVPTIRKTPTN
jgi:hypothetical protein